MLMSLVVRQMRDDNRGGGGSSSSNNKNNSGGGNSSGINEVRLMIRMLGVKEYRWRWPLLGQSSRFCV